MAANDTVAKLDNANPSMPDPNVRIPDNVKAAGSAADELHARMYARTEPTPAAPAKEDLPQPPQPEPIHSQQQADPPPPPPPQHDQQQQHPAPTDADKNVTADEWRHRFLSMQGRYNAKVRDNAAMEEQMQQLAAELVRTQNMVAAPQPQRQQHAPQGEQFITDEDRANYGDELIDLARRAARETVTPEIERLREENQRLTTRVQHTGKRELFTTLDQQLPRWREINVSTRFKAWLRLPNVYTSQIRGEMLNAAVNGAEAPKVLALFRDFLAEEQATGQQTQTVQDQQRETPPPTPREPALDLQVLAAPGRARPASGDSQVPSEKPIYTRTQIAKFYEDSRKGLYAGRQAEYDAMQADLTLAQREGRIR